MPRTNRLQSAQFTASEDPQNRQVMEAPDPSECLESATVLEFQRFQLPEGIERMKINSQPGGRSAKRLT